MTAAEILALAQVIGLDLVLSGDNAIIVGTLAAALSGDLRRRAIFWGVALAVVLRIAMSLGVVWLLQVPGIVLLGGLALLWVAWKMWRDLRAYGDEDEHAGRAAPTSFGGALLAIAMADVSMSLDNALAVAGAAREHPAIMVAGLVLSVALMGVGANLIAKLIERHRWIAWIGLGLILYVAGHMIWEGGHQLAAFSPDALWWTITAVGIVAAGVAVGAGFIAGASA